MYLKKGEGSHEDSMGNKGTLRAGDCQWMTAASGIEHNEGTGHPGGDMHGFQVTARGGRRVLSVQRRLLQPSAPSCAAAHLVPPLAIFGRCALIYLSI